MADISHRVSIRWLPSPASEPTSTIVLTSPERRFVDVRLLLNAQSSPNGTYTPAALDWAIAGSSDSTELKTPDGAAYSHCKWTHWISSRAASVDGVADEGDNHPQADGTILEKGRMLNPATGELGDYEEVWKSEDVEAVHGVGCLVLKLEKDGRRGLAVRLGKYIQAIVRTGSGEGDVTVERLVWDGGEWVKKVRIGQAEVPTDWVGYLGGEAVVDDEVKVGGDVWKVVEKS
ncbi:hypothetical protein OQA88_11031 [Cercophora sp. LCS_1]